MTVEKYVICLAATTFAIVLLGVVGAMIYGLFDPHVDNAEIFKIIGPAFQMIVGSFGGFLGGLQVGKGLR